jgi:hypothetical protein
MKNTTYGLVFLVLGFLVSLVMYGTSCKMTPGFEWATAVYLLNFYTFASQVNPFYDSVHDPKEAKISLV